MPQAPPAPDPRVAELVAPSSACIASLCPLTLARAREHAANWHRNTSVRERLVFVKNLRHLIVENAGQLIEALGRDRPAESLSAEIIPLADACKFLEKSADKILKPRRLGRSGRPVWLRGVSSTIHRVPFGAVLILAPSNYPLFLPAVQTIQSLVAGNAVVIKPAEGKADVAHLFSELLLKAGFPEGLLQIAPESHAMGAAFAGAGFDKVILTGSAETGRKVLASLAQNLTPATVELSGSDAVFLTARADVTRAAKAIAFGLTLNQGKTCIAPRRIFVPDQILGKFTAALTDLLKDLPPVPIAAADQTLIRALIRKAVAGGARIVIPEIESASPPEGRSMRPTILTGVSPRMAIAQTDLFAPVASIIPVKDCEQALLFDLHCPYALGASIFSGGSDDPELRLLVDRIRAGSVVIDDTIVPTADPRIPFGGSAKSGFGTTRGAEGLLELTRPKAVMHRRSRWLPHLDPPSSKDSPILTNYLKTAHSRSLRQRISALKNLIKSARK